MELRDVDFRVRLVLVKPRKALLKTVIISVGNTNDALPPVGIPGSCQFLLRERRERRKVLGSRKILVVMCG